MVAKAKNKKAKSLKFTVPTDVAQYEELVKKGLLTPSQLSDDKRDYAPLDFTSISSREVGRQHSAWATRQAHLIFLIGNLRAEMGNVKHDLKNAEAEWLVRHGAKYKTKWQAEYAVGKRSKRVRRLRKQLAKAEAGLTRFEALSESYKVLREAASREMTRRIDERATKD